jgi:hypothetical protein
MFEIRKLVFLDHIDFDGVLHILMQIMGIAYQTYLTRSSPDYDPKQLHRRKRESALVGELGELEEEIECQKGLYVALPTAELCERLDVKAEVIVTILAKGEQYAKATGRDLYHFYNVLPETCVIRFYQYGSSGPVESSSRLCKRTRCSGP